MPSEPFRPAPPMYKQIADHVAAQILSGELPPGSQLPSENELIAQFKTSRQTIRSAMAEIRAMGLVDSGQGRRSAVRGPATAPAVVDRTVTRRGKAFQADPDEWQDVEPPTVTRTDTTGTTAELLGGTRHAFTVERLLINPAGIRAGHRTIIPFETAEAVPALADSPDQMRPAEIYAALTAAGHHLTWRETVTARATRPDERTSLRLTDYAAPILLITHRVTLGDDRPLILEEFRLSTEHAQLAYTITATKPPARART